MHQAERVLQQLEAAATLDPLSNVSSDSAEATESSQRSGAAEFLRPPYRGRTALMSALNFFQSIGFYGFQAWVPSLLVAEGITLTTSLLYAFVIAIANPVGALLVYGVADRLERRMQVVLSALGVASFGLSFAACRSPLPLIGCGVMVTVCANWMGLTLHYYQSEVFPTDIRARAVGFVYSWSRLSAALVGLLIGYLLKVRGAWAVFILVAGAMGIVVLLTALFGPDTRGLALEAISGTD